MKPAQVTNVSPAPPDPEPQQALIVRDDPAALARPLSIEELHRNLEFVRQVMRNEMREGQDFGKIPGTGEKPTLLQPGAQKLLLTFNLTERVKLEAHRDFPNLHREYEFTVTVRAANGKEWDGVGTCSSLETKYRYRKAERRCPVCGKNAIIQGKAEFGGGWVCFKKKNGCGAKFAERDPKITSQPGGQTENENPPDTWNTVRKMAFKRALVAAAINATNTSELWTQDLEDTRPQESHQDAPGPAEPPPRPPTAPPLPKAPAASQPATAKTLPVPTEEGRAKMLAQLNARPGEANRAFITEFFQKAGMLLPTEGLDDLPLRWIPATAGQMRDLGLRIAEFGNGEPAIQPYPPNGEPPTAKTTVTNPTPAKNAVAVPRDTQPAPPDHPEDWFFKIVVPVPRKGQKRDDYLKHPDTIGSLFDLRHGDDEESQAARQRLYGFVHNFEAKGWVKRSGEKMPPSQTDRDFRAALDAFSEWYEHHHPDEKL